MIWSYGVTTIPERKDTLLPRTVESLRKAGFPSPRLFVDGTCGGFDHFGLHVSYRYPKIKTFGNWMWGMWELYIREPQADRYAMFQDDFVTYRNLKGFLESSPYPERGFLNLYTVPFNHPGNLRRYQIAPEIPGVPDDHRGFYRADGNCKGAVALVFDNYAMRGLLTAPHMTRKPRPDCQERDPVFAWKNLDGAVSEAMRQTGFNEYVHMPTLVMHTGLESSIGNRPRDLPTSFLGEEYDAMKFLGGK